MIPPSGYLRYTQRSPFTSQVVSSTLIPPSRPIEETCADEDEIRDCVAETVIHEFGHYFGMSEEQIEEIEEKFWRGEPLDDV